MEAEERPNKIRKLNHDSDLGRRNVSNGASSFPPEPSKDEQLIADGTVSASDDDHDDFEEDVETTADAQERPNAQTDGTATQPMSKNQLKKLRKREEWDAGRDFRKAKRKQKVAEKKARQKEARAERAAASPTSFELAKKPRRHVRLPYHDSNRLWL